MMYMPMMTVSHSIAALKTVTMAKAHRRITPRSSKTHVAITHQHATVKAGEPRTRGSAKLVRIEQLGRAHPSAARSRAEQQTPGHGSPPPEDTRRTP